MDGFCLSVLSSHPAATGNQRRKLPQTHRQPAQSQQLRGPPIKHGLFPRPLMRQNAVSARRFHASAATPAACKQRSMPPGPVSSRNNHDNLNQKYSQAAPVAPRGNLNDSQKHSQFDHFAPKSALCHQTSGSNNFLSSTPATCPNSSFENSFSSSNAFPYEMLIRYYKRFKGLVDSEQVCERDMDANGRPTSTSVVRMQARLKLTGMSEVQFQELCTDMFDELERRRDGEGKNSNSLPFHPSYNQKRNQARSRLAAVGHQRLASLINDILNELLNRYPSLRSNFSTDKYSQSTNPNLAIYQHEALQSGAGSFTANSGAHLGPNSTSKSSIDYSPLKNLPNNLNSAHKAGTDGGSGAACGQPSENRLEEGSFTNVTHQTPQLAFQDLVFEKAAKKSPSQGSLPHNSSVTSLESLDSLMADLGHFGLSEKSDDEIEDLKSQIAATEQRIASLEKLACENREFISRLQSENSALQEELEFHKKKASDFERRCLALEKELEMETERFETALKNHSQRNPDELKTLVSGCASGDHPIIEQSQSIFAALSKASEDLMMKMRTDKNLISDSMRNLISISKQLIAVAEEIEREIESKRNSAEFYKEVSKLKSHKTKSIQIVTSIVAALKEKNHFSMVESLLGDLNSEVLNLLEIIKKLSIHCAKAKPATNSTNLSTNDQSELSLKSPAGHCPVQNTSLSASNESLLELSHLRKKSEEVISLIHKLMETTRPMALLNPTEQCPCLSEIKSSVAHILTNATILKAKKTNVASREKITQAIDMLKVTTEKLEDFRVNLQDGRIAVNDKGCKQKLVWLAYDVAKYTNELMVALG